MKKALIFITVTLLVTCSPRPDETAAHTPQSHPQEFTQVLDGQWPPKSYSKVVGYRYEIPDRTDSLDLLYPVEGKSPGYRLHHALLAKQERARRELTAEQVQRLLKGTFSSNGHTGYGACYEPHHIFLFYGPEGNVVQAIEVCFGCKMIIAAPIPESGTPWADLRKLATLCDELGLWFPDWPLTEYVTEL